jgi:hypothetical protein
MEGDPNIPVSGNSEFFAKDLRVNWFMPLMYNAPPLARHDARAQPMLS